MSCDSESLLQHRLCPALVMGRSPGLRRLETAGRQVVPLPELGGGLVTQTRLLGHRRRVVFFYVLE